MRRFPRTLCTFTLAAALTGLLAAPTASAASVPPVPSPAQLTTVSARLTVTVTGVRTDGARRWVDHVVDTAAPSGGACVLTGAAVATGRHGRYVTSRDYTCPPGSAELRRTVRELRRSHRWYTVTITGVATMEAEFTVPAAQLPDGADVDLDAVTALVGNQATSVAVGVSPRQAFLRYRGRPLSARQLTAVRAAFARQLGVTVAAVSVHRFSPEAQL